MTYFPRNVANGIPKLNNLGDVSFAQLPSIARVDDLPLGDVVYHAHNTTTSYSAGSYAKVKTITLNHLPAATLRIFHKVNVPYSAMSSRTKIYQNGVAVGTERYKGSEGEASWSEDIAGWTKDDTLEIYGYVSSQYAELKDFEIRGLLAINELSNSTP